MTKGIDHSLHFHRVPLQESNCLFGIVRQLNSSGDAPIAIEQVNYIVSLASIVKHFRRYNPEMVFCRQFAGEFTKGTNGKVACHNVQSSFLLQFRFVYVAPDKRTDKIPYGYNIISTIRIKVFLIVD